MRKSIRSRTQSVRLTDYERFPNQAISDHVDLIEEAMMAESEPIGHNQTTKDEN